ncbi:MAG: hypothetical protein WCO56_19400 [Verrucomicrobiota bacterium]
MKILTIALAALCVVHATLANETATAKPGVESKIPGIMIPELTKVTPEIRIDYRQDKLGYKLTLRLAHQPDGEQNDFGPSVGEFIPTSK